MKILVSVRSVEEARLAVCGGADFIDLKEPGQGALGGLATATVQEIVAALRADASALPISAASARPISATIGDVPMAQRPRILERVEAVGACGVDYVKVGIERGSGARAVLEALAGSTHAIVPVFIADRGIDWADVSQACALGFPGVMLDTADKHAGSLFDRMPVDALRCFIDTVRGSGAMVGLAGALRAGDAPQLRALAPDFAGFRTAVCAGDRASDLDPQRLRELAALLRDPLAASPA